ncbi:hypothetical protein EDE15_0484 [Edaphobacter aggregans]|uniref:Uncharacterized protein n=1 Tax=Edaphobacter aggregans TaxID=570835 RepID=A0A3R9NW23_9BACT|nr:hypothetical protein EDE15_0484 [Edaphobacter aggregans]
MPHVVVPVGNHLHGLSTSLQLTHNLVGDTPLRATYCAIACPKCGPSPLWSLNRLLYVIAEIYDPSCQRDLALWLAFTPIAPKERSPFVRNQRRDQSVECALARLQLAGMFLIKREKGTAVLHNDAVSP